MVAAWAGKHVCGMCHGNYHQVRSNDASSWNGKRRAPHHECDPTTPVGVAWGGRSVDQWFLGSEDRPGGQVFQWLCIVQAQQVVDESQVVLGCLGVGR